MKTKMILLTGIICLAFSASLFAQDEAVDQNIQACLKEAAQNLEEPFSMADWSAKMDFYLRKTIQRVSSEHTRSIGKLKEPTLMLAKLAETCESLKPLQKPFNSLVTLYEENVEITTVEGVFGNQLEVKTDKKTVETMKKQVDKIRKTLGIEKVYYRID